MVRDRAGAGDARVHVVLNWLDELRAAGPGERDEWGSVLPDGAVSGVELPRSRWR